MSVRERRRHPRYRIDQPIRLRPADRPGAFGGRGRNLSRGGALVAVPLSIPLRAGQQLEMRLLPRTTRETDSEAPSRNTDVRTARVVRVERTSTLLDGLQLVGLEFE